MTSPACRLGALFLVLLALFQSLPVAVGAWEARQWPDTAVAWLRLALLPGALWLYLRYFSLFGCRSCALPHTETERRTDRDPPPA